MYDQGGGISFSSLNQSSVYPLVDGLSAKSASSSFDEEEARYRDRMLCVCFDGRQVFDVVKRRAETATRMHWRRRR